MGLRRVIAPALLDALSLRAFRDLPIGKTQRRVETNQCPAVFKSE